MMFPFAALRLLIHAPGGGSSLRRLMVDHAVGAVRRESGVVIRDFTSGADLFRLPGAPNSISDVAYDFRSSELYVLGSVTHGGARLYVRNLANRGSDWKAHYLPIENWSDLQVMSLDESRRDGQPVRLALNSKYVAVVYEGPRVRLLERKTYTDLGEVELDHFATNLVQGPEISFMSLSKVGKTVAVCVDDRMTNSFGQSDLYCGEIGRKFTHLPPEESGPAGCPGTGLVPLAGGGWAYAFDDGSLQAFFPTADGRYRRKGKAQHLGHDVFGSAYDSLSGWSYFIVEGGLRSVSCTFWPRLETHTDLAPTGVAPAWGQQVLTLAGSRWVLEGGEAVKVDLWEKRAHGTLTYRGNARLGRSEELVELHS
ncbi:MAG: hypothetical protein ACYC96_00430 [Fimbriimonadaceae bacterium]